MQRTRFYIICIVVFLKTEIKQRNSWVKNSYYYPLYTGEIDNLER